jgi:hypothetical protein
MRSRPLLILLVAGLAAPAAGRHPAGLLRSSFDLRHAGGISLTPISVRAAPQSRDWLLPHPVDPEPARPPSRIRIKGKKIKVRIPLG